jgi:crotonobetaine/carnitine-CoA ligase
VLDQDVLAPHAVSRWSAATPDAVALQHVDGRNLTYTQLDAVSHTWAAALARQGIAAGSHVGTMLSNRFEGHTAMLAIGWLRGIEVPLNTAYVARMLQYALDLADVSILVTESQFLERILAVSAELPRLRTVLVIDGDDGDRAAPAWAFDVVGMDEFLDGIAPASGLEGPRDRDTACLMFTSGTTGPSKAVIAPWGLVTQNWTWVPDDAIDPGDGLYCPMPLFHNSGRGAFNYAMHRGARLVFRDRFSASSFWDDVREHHCRVAATVGPMTALLWSAPPAPDDADNPLESVVCGPMIPEMEAFKARFGVRATTTYGQTEIGCPLSSGWQAVPPASCGKLRTTYPWPEIRIADEFDEPVPRGQVGEMLVRTTAPWAMNVGYHKMPEQTAAAWRNGWFHTGDAFTQDDDGNYYFQDRMRDTIRRRGENISSFEVENLVAEHPDVLEVAAIAVPAALGEDEVMVALVVRDPATFDPSTFVRFLAERMPRFMVPRYVEVMDDLPRVETSLRVKKTDLRSRGITEHTWDREAAGIVL